VTGRYVHGKQVAGPSTVTRVLAMQYSRPAGITLAIVPTIESYSKTGEQLVRDVRAVPAPFPVGVTGAAPQLVDVEHSLFSRMPLAMAIIGLATFVLLFLLTGSVVVPLKALALNLLSLSAMFGAMVWIFQQGHLRWLFGNFLATGYLDTTTPILMFCVAFGLSMDYEVFLLSRIKEEYDLTGDTRASVAAGLERTGGIVTSAAALFAIINISFTTSGITFIKLFGLGLTIAVILDATLVRAFLVPSVMRLMGDLNWWAPPWARKVHARFGFTESGRRRPAEGAAT
jgi:RND superfamily putative drug exporter